MFSSGDTLSWPGFKLPAGGLGADLTGTRLAGSSVAWSSIGAEISSWTRLSLLILAAFLGSVLQWPASTSASEASDPGLSFLVRKEAILATVDGLSPSGRLTSELTSGWFPCLPACVMSDAASGTDRGRTARWGGRREGVTTATGGSGAGWPEGDPAKVFVCCAARGGGGAILDGTWLAMAGLVEPWRLGPLMLILAPGSGLTFHPQACPLAVFEVGA